VRAVVQRVREASVVVAGERVAEMGPGLLALVGVAHADKPDDASELARKLVHLRVFEDTAGKINESLLDTGGTLGVVSQFTLFGDTAKGRRPSFGAAAPPELAEPLVEAVANAARKLGVTVVTGRFGAKMQVALVNAGPFTLLLDTRSTRAAANGSANGS
jgi:D-tyrosyl-tRNA(Tyr) deacylase